MRLIDTATLEIEEFIDVDSAPAYAILSHRWSSGEVSYKDWRKGRCEPNTPGHNKVIEGCAFARIRGKAWLWVDTVCIDKSSSSDMSESINSMFHWYSKAAECYAYLADVTEAEQIQSSEWWNRGWTLQELIAPLRVVFVSASWIAVGVKSGLRDAETHANAVADLTDITELVSDITKIPLEVLASPGSRFLYSVAQRMSWMAGRTTTRVEDMAYCLLGLFDVHLPLLYGERDRAFLRLQREIFSRTGDETIFAWSAQNLVPSASRRKASSMRPGIFAEGPHRFEGMHHVRATRVKDPTLTITNHGVEVRTGASTPSRAYYSTQDTEIACLVLDAVDNSRHHLVRTLGSLKCLVYLRTTVCGHYILLGPNTACETFTWQPFTDHRTLLMHNSRKEAYRQCASIETSALNLEMINRLA